MEFLRALEKAKELGLTNEEFLPIYLQELGEKTAVLSRHNSEKELFPQSDEATQSEPQNKQQQQEWKSWHQHTIKQSVQPTETFVHDLKTSVDNMKDFLCSQLLNLKQESMVENERLINIQQDIQNFVKEIHNDIQTLLPDQHDGGSIQSDRNNEGKLEIFHRALVQKFDDHVLKVKKEIQQAQEEIVKEFSCYNCNHEGDKFMQTQRQEQLFMLQESLINASHSNLQQCLHQWQTELSATIKDLAAVVIGNFNKTCEFQNIVSSEMYQQKINQQVLLLNTASVFSAVAQNTNLLNENSYVSQRQNLEHASVNQVDSNRLVLSFQENAVNCEPHEDSECNVSKNIELLGQDLNTSSGSRIVSLFESGTPSSGSIISFIYDFEVRNTSYFFEFRKEFQKVTYDEKLGCCLRASIYFSTVEDLEDMLHISLDMCQVGKDMILPDLLRISSEITLFDKCDVFSYWVVAREKGLFHLPRSKENGWFEVCAAFLDIKSSEFTQYIKNGVLSFCYSATVFNREVNNMQEPDSNLSCELNYDHPYTSDSDDSEYFDADLEKNDKTENLNLSSLLSGVYPGSSEVTDEESVLQLPFLENEEEQLMVQESHSTYFLPICKFSSLIGSESLVDSPDWYLHFLGHSVHAVLGFLDDDTMMICIDYFHDKCNDCLPELAIFRCRVSLVDQTDQMEDWVMGERIEVFDLTRETPADWMDSCVCMVSCNAIKNRFKNSDKIVLQFDFIEMD